MPRGAAGAATMPRIKKISIAPTVWRLPQVLEYTARSRSSVLRDVALGIFPRPLKLGQFSVGWLASEIQSWLADRISERDGRAS